MKTFQNSFTNYHRSRQQGMLLVAIGVGICFLLAGGILLGLGDLTLAFSNTVRLWLGGLVLAVVVVALLSAIRIALRLDPLSAAQEADRASASSRRLISSAASLPDEPCSPLQGYLTDRLRSEANEELKSFSTKQTLPTARLKKVGGIMVGLLALILIMSIINFGATLTTLKRLTQPTADIAPWSPLTFTLLDSTPAVTYGNTLTIETEISGGDLDHPVECLVRQGDKVETLPALRDSQGNFARTFHGVVQPFEIAFITGRARSEWYQVEVLMQPLILEVNARTIPPVYTRQEPFAWTVKGTEISALNGSQIELRIASNRPLRSGSMTITPQDGRSDSSPLVVKGTPSESNSQECVFRWEARHSGKLEAKIFDIQGTEGKSPLELSFVAEGDQAPSLQLTSPANYIMATPDAELKLSGFAEDDHGLSKVHLVRALVGLRDRSSVLGAAMDQGDFEFSQALDLSDLGLDAGQQLEFYLEGYDHNPNLMGVATSDLVKIDVISHADYAERLRYQTTLKQFFARYEAVGEQMQELRKSLDKLSEVSEEGELVAFQEALEETEKAHEKAKELLDKVADDFQAFDHEGALKEGAKNVSEALSENLEAIEQFSPEMTRGEYDREITMMKDRVGMPMRQLQELTEEGGILERAGEVMQLAAVYKRLYETQKSLNDRLLTLAKEVYLGDTSNTAQLEPLARMQERNREGLEKMAEDLAEALEDFPEELGDMKRGSQVFLDKLAELEIPSAMNRATSAARDGNSLDAAKNAQLAQDLMEQLMDEGDCMGQMCKGNMPSSCSQGCKNLGSTMSQLLQSLIMQEMRQGGFGNTAGIGQGGSASGSQSGYMSQGYAPQIPIYGPDRMRFDGKPKGQSGDGEGKGGQGDGKQVQIEQTTAISPTDQRHSDLSTLPIDNVPEKYRDALKIYFTPTTD